MLIDFLKTTRTKEELKTALEVLREFKECEGQQEWLWGSGITWAKLEQMEEYLAHLADGEDLAKDTLEFIKRMEKQNGTT